MLSEDPLTISLAANQGQWSYANLLHQSFKINQDLLYIIPTHSGNRKPQKSNKIKCIWFHMATLATHKLYTCTYKKQNKNKQKKQTKKWESLVHTSESHSCSVIFLKAWGFHKASTKVLVGEPAGRYKMEQVATFPRARSETRGSCHPCYVLSVDSLNGGGLGEQFRLGLGSN